MHPNTKPRWLKMRSGRLNITFRDHSELSNAEIDLGYNGENRLEGNRGRQDGKKAAGYR